MSRTLFRRTASSMSDPAGAGYVTPRGDLILKLQQELRRAGVFPHNRDGVYGRYTENAVKEFQRSRGLPETGEVTEDVWYALFGVARPPVFQRCLQLTACFEGHSYTKAAGDFDGAGITWGVIGFTLKFGSLQHVIRSALVRDPAILDTAFGALAGRCHEIVTAPDNRSAIALAYDYALDPGNCAHLREEWSDGFYRLGCSPVVREQQQALACRDYWERRALRDIGRLGFQTELGAALAFDIAVQCGGVHKYEELPRIQERYAQSGDRSERLLRCITADVVAHNGGWVSAVLARKMTIAEAEGEAQYRSWYVLADWGLDESFHDA